MNPILQHVCPTRLNQELIHSYLKTNYEVHAEPHYVLKIGNQSTQLTDYMKKSSCLSAAYITAYNPYGESLLDHDNEKRNQYLNDEIVVLGYNAITGVGRDADGLWPGEKSFLIPNITYDKAVTLGNKYEQNAILWISDTGYVQLLLLV